MKRLLKIFTRITQSLGAFLSGCLSSPELPPTTPDFQDAFDTYQRGHYYDAYKIYLLLTDQGNARAQYQLAVLYRDGKGRIRRNYTKAVELFELAAKQGNVDAQFALGWIYLKDERYETSYQEAVKWLELAG